MLSKILSLKVALAILVTSFLLYTFSVVSQESASAKVSAPTPAPKSKSSTTQPKSNTVTKKPASQPAVLAATKKPTYKAPAVKKPINITVDNLFANIKTTTKDLKVTGTSDFGGEVQFNKKNVWFAGAHTFYINGSGDARFGNIIAEKGLDTNGPIHNAINNEVTISDPIRFTGRRIFNPNDILFLDDDVTISGLTTMQSGLSVNGNITPASDNTFTLGTTSLRWASGHFGPGSVVVHNDTSDTLKGTFGFTGNRVSLVTDAASALWLYTGTNQGLFMNTGGNLGVGTTNPGSQLAVSGGTSLGATYSPFVAPTNGLIVQGNVGLGSSRPFNALDVSGSMALGSLPIADLPQSNMLYVSGNVGLSTSNPSQKLAVSGNALVFGNLGVGTTAPAQAFDIEAAVANMTFSSTVGNKQIITGGTTNLALMPGGNVGIATTNPWGILHVGNQGTPVLFASAAGGNVGIGTTSVGARLVVVGRAMITAAGGTGNVFVTGGNETITTANQNTIVGDQAANTLTTGDDNAIFGFQAGKALTGGSRNIFLGSQAGLVQTTLSDNIFIGYTSGSTSVNSGATNVYVGNYTGANLSTGDSNTFVGHAAGQGAAGGSATANSTFGYQAGNDLSTGAYNTLLGYVTGGTIATGSRNTIIGANADVNAVALNNSVGLGESISIRGSSSVAIGYSTIVRGDNQLVIDNSNTTAPLIWGDFGTNTLGVIGNVGIGVTNPQNKLDVSGATAIGSLPADPLLQSNMLYVSGNVGIGTSNPGAALAVSGNGLIFGNLAIGTTAPAQALDLEAAVANLTFSNSVGNHQILTGGASNLGLMAGGNVGVGTTNPTALFSVGTSSQFQVNSSGLVFTQAGSQGAPSFSFVNDPDTGLSNIAANTLDLSTGGISRIRVDSGGNVGIGLTAPLSTLAVSGNSAIGALYSRFAAPTSGLIVQGNTGIGISSPVNALDVSGSSSFGVPPSQALPQANSAYFSGNVGIGMTAPRATLDIAGSVGIGSTAPSAVGPLPTTTALYVQGNVGIGTTNPGANNMKILGSLCVKGNDAACAGSAAGNIYATNTTVQNADVAENYVSSIQLEAGTVVELAGDGNTMAVAPSSGAYSSKVLGVISTAPGLTLNSDAVTDETHPFITPLALSGRVPVKVSSKSPAIAAGDFLAASSEPGLAAKAERSGLMIGKALEAWTAESGKATVIAYVYNQYADLDILKSLSALASADGSAATPSVAVDPTAVASSSAEPSLAAPSTPVLAGSESGIIEDAVSVKITKDVQLDQKLNVLGKLTGSDLILTGSLSFGTLMVDGLNNSVTTAGADLKLQTSPLAGKVDIFNGKVVISQNGDLVTSGSVTADKLNIKGASVGSVTLSAGQTSIDVTTSALTDKSLIFTSTSSPVAVGVAKKDATTFTVSLKEALTSDLQVNWWIIN